MTELIEEYMKDLYEQTAACNIECAAYDSEIRDLQHKVELLANERNKKAEPFEERIDSLREQIESMALVIAATVKCEYGQVKYKKGSERRSWDLDALDNICNADPGIKEKLWPHRSTTPTSPSVTIVLKA